MERAGMGGSGWDLDGIWMGSGRDLDGIWTGSGRDLRGGAWDLREGRRAHLPGRVQPRHDASVSTEYVTHLVESDATHAVVQHGHDPPHVQSLIQRDRRVVKVDLAKFIPALRRRRVVRRKGAFERIGERGGV